MGRGCPTVQNFFVGHYVRRESIMAGHFDIVVGHCPMTDGYFAACTYNPKHNNNTAVRNHLQECKCKSSISDFKIIGSASNDYLLCLKESLLIHKDKPLLNKNEKSIPLKLFD